MESYRPAAGYSVGIISPSGRFGAKTPGGMPSPFFKEYCLANSMSNFWCQGNSEMPGCNDFAIICSAERYWTTQIDQTRLNVFYNDNVIVIWSARICAHEVT